eukprot:6802945-Pyramimonas_sp.AAC.1
MSRQFSSGLGPTASRRSGFGNMCRVSRRSDGVRRAVGRKANVLPQALAVRRAASQSGRGRRQRSSAICSSAAGRNQI